MICEETYFLVFLLIINHLVYPNESRTVLGSSVEIIDNENTNVVMREEEINITLHKDYYEVDVTFDFFNTGEDEYISLGFPVEARFQQFPSNEGWAVLDDFKSYINGNIIQEYTIKEDIQYHGDKENVFTYITYTKWYIREVLFSANENTVSRVTYKAPYSHGGFTRWAGYIFGTGHNWKGPIGKMAVKIAHNDDIMITYYEIGSIKQNEMIQYFSWEGDGRYKFEFKDIEPAVTDRIELYIKEHEMFNAKGNNFEDNALGWIWDEYLLYDDISELRLYTKNQLELFINFFYAIHGYNFDDKLYKTFFQNLQWIKNWDDKYTVNDNFSENDFNEFERKNIDYLLNLEKMMPFSESDFIEFERKKADYLLDLEKMIASRDNNKRLDIRVGKYMAIIAIIAAILLLAIKKIKFLTGKRRET